MVSEALDKSIDITTTICLLSRLRLQSSVNLINADFRSYSVSYTLRCTQTIVQCRTGLIEKQEVSQKHYLGPVKQ